MFLKMFLFVSSLSVAYAVSWSESPADLVTRFAGNGASPLATQTQVFWFPMDFFFVCAGGFSRKAPWCVWSFCVLLFLSKFGFCILVFFACFIYALLCNVVFFGLFLCPHRMTLPRCCGVWAIDSFVPYYHYFLLWPTETLRVLIELCNRVIVNVTAGRQMESGLVFNQHG